MPNRFLSSTKEYRFGYQGQYAEKDAETGLNHFEARDYDSRIGRWTTTGLAGQYWSSYVGMGNNPVGGIDPDGRWVKGAGFWNNIFHSDASIKAKYMRSDPNLYFDIDEITITAKDPRTFTQVTSNTWVASTFGSNKNPNYVFQYPQNQGSSGQPNSDGLIWIGCMSCHAENGAFHYAAYNSQEKLGGTLIANTALLASPSLLITKTATETFIVTEDGVILPKGAKIPSGYIQNPYRSSSYGIIENGKFVEKLRIDPATALGMKRPNYSHFHLNGSGKHSTNGWPWYK